jgi:hypothetical protein
VFAGGGYQSEFSAGQRDGHCFAAELARPGVLPLSVVAPGGSGGRPSGDDCCAQARWCAGGGRRRPGHGGQRACKLTQLLGPPSSDRVLHARYRHCFSYRGSSSRGMARLRTYSVRRACTGSMEAALRAGIILAKSAQTPNAMTAPPRTNGSQPRTW